MERIPNPDRMCHVGRIYRAGQRSERIALPFADGDTLLAPGPVAPETVALLPVAVELIHRIAPWATIRVAPIYLDRLTADSSFVPNFIHRIGGVDFGEYGGSASRNAPWNININLSRHAVQLPQTAAHEAWHCLEYRLPAEIIEAVDAAIEGDHFTPCDPYSSSRLERRARAFDAWAARIIEGLPGQFQRGGIDEIFAMAWTGELARQVLADSQRVGEAA